MKPRDALILTLAGRVRSMWLRQWLLRKLSRDARAKACAEIFDLLGGVARMEAEAAKDPEGYAKLMQRWAEKLPPAEPSDDLQQLLDKLDKETKL